MGQATLAAKLPTGFAEAEALAGLLVCSHLLPLPCLAPSPFLSQALTPNNHLVPQTPS